MRSQFNSPHTKFQHIWTFIIEKTALIPEKMTGKTTQYVKIWTEVY